MSISSGIGLISGIDTVSLIDQLLAIDAQSKVPIFQRINSLNASKAAMLDINSRLLGMGAAARAFRIDSVFDSYRQKIAGEIQARDKGSLLAFADGPATTFGIEGAQNRGQMFASVGDDVYKGMIVGMRTEGSRV